MKIVASVVVGHNEARIDPSWGGRIVVRGPDAAVIAGRPQDTLEKDLQRQLRAEIKARFVDAGVHPLDIPVKWESE